MAGATNRHLKAMGFREAGIQQIRTTGGRGLSLESAISSARAHGVALPGPALQRVGASASEGWKAASRGEKTKRPEKPGESLDAYRARDLASRDPATMRAAIREQIKRVRDVGHNADVNKLSDMLRARNAAAKSRAAERGGQQDLFGANPAPRGPSPFEVRAKAAAERRAAMVASAQQRTGRLPQALGGAARGMLAQRREMQAAVATWNAGLVEGKSSQHWLQAKGELEKTKPRPLNKLYRNPAAITPEIKAKHDAAMKTWSAAHRKVTKNHKQAAAAESAAWHKATPAERRMFRAQSAREREAMPKTKTGVAYVHGQRPT
jgi:hypothetical protein